MSGYKIAQFTEAPDVLGDYPGEMRFLTETLGNEQVAVTWRRMPKHTGGKGSYGHFHHTQEEVYVVIKGELQFKLEDEVVDVPAGSAVRVAPEVPRSVWNDRDEDAELIIVSTRLEDQSSEHGKVDDFWPE